MQLAPRIRSHLEQLRLNFAIVSHPPTQTLPEAATATHVDAHNIARAIVLQDSRGLLLIVLPANHLVDFHALRELLGDNCKPVSAEEVKRIFSDCEAGSVPPLGEPYGLPVIIDSHFANCNHVHFEAGYHHALLRMRGEDFDALHHASVHAEISRPISILENRDVREFMLPDEHAKNSPFPALRPLEDIRNKIAGVDRLPTMPEMANRILRLLNNPKATIEDLTNIIQGDPSLTAQIIRYARSAFFGYRGKVATLPEAVTRVLGFDTTLNMALRLSASRTFHNPADGPLGLQAFWKHATYSAALAQALANTIGGRLPIKPGVAYLAGLLHNFGYLLAGHLFRAEFFLLNRVVAANPHIPILLIERRVLGIEHTQIGSQLMALWNMPETVIICCNEHHNEAYVGEQASYVQLMTCVDHLLRAHGIGDGSETTPPATLLTALGLDLDKARYVTDKLLESTETLDAMSRQMSAA